MRRLSEEIRVTEQDGAGRSDRPMLAIDWRIRLSVSRELIINALCLVLGAGAAVVVLQLVQR